MKKADFAFALAFPPFIHSGPFSEREANYLFARQIISRAVFARHFDLRVVKRERKHQSDDLRRCFYCFHLAAKEKASNKRGHDTQQEKSARSQS